MMSESKCPEVLRKVLDLTTDFEKQEEKKYSQFLLEAERVTSVKDGGLLDIKLSSRLTDISNQSDGINSSLALIFNFYAKLQNPSAQMQKGGLTYDEIKISNETLSFYETLLLLRDFDVLPKLITKDELLFLWKVGNIQSIHSGKGSLRMLNFRDFADMLAKIAIYAYNKPGLRQMVIRINGEMINPLEQVQALAAYLRLDDYERTRQTVRTVGVETATLLHNRSTGEKNHRTKKYLRDDLRGARIADFLAREVVSKRESPLEDDINQEQDFDVYDPQVFRIGTALQRNVCGVEESITAELSSVAEDKMEISRVQRIMCELRQCEKEHFSSPVGEIMQGGVMPRDGHVVKVDSSDKLPIKGLYVPRVHICETQERALMQYHPSLGKEFMRYAVDNTFGGINKASKNSSIPEENSVFEPSGAPFIDVGTILQGKECSIRVVVINRGSHEANIQISTKGFAVDELTVIKMPKAIAPGLRQVVVVKFRPPRDFIGGCFCSISISSVTNPSNMLFQEETTTHCPVYFNVSRGPSQGLPESSSRCTIRTLPSLLAAQGLVTGVKSTDDLTLFSRTKANSERVIFHDSSIHNTNPASSTLGGNSKSSKTRRLSVRHSLR